MVRLFQALWCIFHLEAVSGSHLPRQVVSQYTNSSASIEPTSSSPSGPFCCQIYAPAVGLVVWYTDHDVEYSDGTVITQYLRYNNTIVPTATITQPPNSTVSLGGYIADLGETPILPGVRTDINGPYYGGAYDGTVLLAATDTIYDDEYTTIASPTPFMTFASLDVFSGQLNSAGTCMGTYESARSTYEVASVAQSWFSNAARAPNVPYNLAGSGVWVSSFWISTPYYSFVSTQTSTWGQKVVITEIDSKMFTWLAQNPDVLSRVPSILSCSPVAAAGAPQLHIRVSFLTSSSAVTGTTNAMYYNTATQTSAVPASRTPSTGPTSTKSLIVPITKPSQKSPALELPTQTESSVLKSTQDTPAESSPPGQTQHISSETPNSSDRETVQVIAPTSDKSPESTTPDSTAAIASAKPSPPENTTPASLQASQSPQHEVSSGQSTVDGPEPTSAALTNHVSDEPSKSASSQEAGASSVAPSASEATIQTVQSTGPILVVIGGVTATALSSGMIVVGSTSPHTGGLVVQISGTNNIAQPSETVASGGTLPASYVSTSVALPVPVVIGEVTATPAASGGFVIGDQTVAPGAPAVEISGTTYSIQTSQSNIIANGQTIYPSTLPMPTVPVAISADTEFISSVAYVIGGQTLSAGGPAVEISGSTYSLRPSGGSILVNGEPVSASTVVPQALPSVPVVLGEATAIPIASDVYVLADQTISRGGSAVTVSGTTYFLPSSETNVELNGQPTSISPVQALPATIIIGEVTAKPKSSGAYYLVGDQTLNPGGSAIEVSGVTYSLPNSGANIVVNGATSILSPTDIPTVSAVAFGSETAVPLLAGGYLVGSQMLSPGGSAIEVSGTVYSLPTSGSSVVINGQPTQIEALYPEAVITLGSQAYTAVAASATPLIIASQTLIPGGSQITVRGTIFSLSPLRTGEVVVNGHTISLAGAASGVDGLTIGSQSLSFTLLSSGVVIASQTLYPGGSVITVDGQALSMPVGGSAVVVRSGTQTTTENLGEYIWQGIAASTSDSVSGSSLNSGVSSSSAVPAESSMRRDTISTTSESSTGTETAASSKIAPSNEGSNLLGASRTGATVALAVFVFAVVVLQFAY